MPDIPMPTMRQQAAPNVVVLDQPGTVKIIVAGPRARFSCRGPASVVARAFGVGDSSAVCRATHAGDRVSLWLGPDERLLLAPVVDAPAIVTAFASLATEVPHALVDVGHRSIGMLITGPRAARLLQSACPLDFDISAFGVDMCTRTIFGKAEIVVWRYAADAFHVEVMRSFQSYLAALMIEAARDV